MSTAAKSVTAEDLMDMPDDEVRREIIRGELREEPMSRRNWMHSETLITIGHLLKNWLDARPEPRGRISGGEAGFRLRREPETFVGIDVAVVSAELAARRDRETAFYDGPPVLAVEILSPSDKHREVRDKIREYLDVGTVVWEVDPDLRSVRVHRPGHPPAHYNETEELVGDPYLPGFRVAVARIFE